MLDNSYLSCVGGSTPEMKTAFRNWFRNSKVINAQGKPLVMYHGTGADIDVFDVSKRGTNYDDRAGFFFTSKPSNAWPYAKKGESPNIMPVYIALQNPIIFKTKEDAAQHWYARLSDYAADAARNDGYDGIIVLGRGGESLVVAFHPEQIKSAIGNPGTYLNNNPSISDGQALTLGLAIKNAKNKVSLNDSVISDKARASFDSLDAGRNITLMDSDEIPDYAVPPERLKKLRP